LLAGVSFHLLAFCFIGDVFCVHSSTLIPAYFSMIFFNPYPGKLIVSFASSPSPSRRITTPRPYFGCWTVLPAPNLPLRNFGEDFGAGGRLGVTEAGRFWVWVAAGRLTGGTTAGKTRTPAFGAGGVGADFASCARAMPDGTDMPRSAKNCAILSSELKVRPVYRLRLTDSRTSYCSENRSTSSTCISR